uniref:Uncharacterized protein n=1 Tax=Anguilla anguilla TaxID=7936 RepID=A0A0E9WGK1_ANGAN
MLNWGGRLGKVRGTGQHSAQLKRMTEARGTRRRKRTLCPMRRALLHRFPSQQFRSTPLLSI